MIKKLFLKLKKKLCRHDYKPSSYYVLDNHIVCTDICPKCGRCQTKLTEYNLDSKSRVERLGYVIDYYGPIWTKAIRDIFNNLDNSIKIKEDSLAQKIRILGVSRPSVKSFSVKDSDINE